MAHESQVVSTSPELEPEHKRQVSYNPEAVLCPACKKRIRLNNNGRIRTHMAGKVGSDKCVGSNSEPEIQVHYVTKSDIQALTNEAEVGHNSSRLTPRSSDIFSDPA